MTTNGHSGAVKARGITDPDGARGFGAYRRVQYGDTSLGFALLAEVLTGLLGGLPGAAGLFLRSKLYRPLFGAAGRGILVGRHVTLRHPRKIRLGAGVFLDDGVVLDAKGDTNRGIELGDRVFVGRHSILYCKNGDLLIAAGCSISSNCTLFSSNRLTVGEGTVIGAYSYLLSGGEYDSSPQAGPFAQQSGMQTVGPLTVGPDAWIGARVTVLDGANIGRRCVIGAGAVVTRPVPDGSLALGVPARVVRSLEKPAAG
jgi:acetyltransferase-like isoleucine patch superfamily enzyme